MSASTVHRPPAGYLLLGTLALLAALFCAWDALQRKPTDGAEWKLGKDQIEIGGIVPNGPADLATSEGEPTPLETGDVIEGIDRKPISSPRQAALILRSHQVGDVVPYMVNRNGEIFEADLRLASTRTTNVTIYFIYCGLGLIYFLVGLYVFWKNPWQAPARVFYLLGVVFLLYFFSSSGRSVEYYWSQVFSRNMAALSSLLVPPLFLHFFLIFPEPRSVVFRHKWLLPSLYLLPLVYYLLFTHDQFYGSHPASFSGLQQMVLGLYFTAGLISLLATYIHTTDTTLRQKVKFLTLGTVTGVLPYLVFTLAFEVMLGRNDFALLGAVPLVLVPVSFGYSIARYRLMDVEVIIRRSLIYAVLTGLLVGAYVLIVIVVGNILLKASGQTSQLVAIVATLLLAAVFAPARDRIQSFLERSFFREKHDMQVALQELALAIPRTIERDALFDLVTSRVTALLHPQRFAILTCEAEVLHLPEPLGGGSLTKLSAYLADRRSALLLEALHSQLNAPLRPESGEEGARQRALLSADMGKLLAAGFEVVVPALAGDRLVAALCLGPKRSEVAYEGAELELLTIVAGQLGVQLENTRLYDEAIERRQLEEELALARSIQQRLLPREVPRIESYEIAALNLPSRQISGDYYDFVPMDEGRIGVVISDVSGKGMGASLLASNLQASLRALAGNHSSPSAILRAVNTTLYASTDSDRFATLFLAALEPRQRRLIYSSAGHNPPLLSRADGSCVWLEDGATPLGAFDGMDYPETTVTLEAGDVLVLYTDGVTEAEDPQDRQFGIEGLQEIVCRHHDRPAEELTHALKDAVFAHVGPNRGSAERNAGDDLTIVVLRVLGDETTDATGGRPHT